MDQDQFVQLLDVLGRIERHVQYMAKSQENQDMLLEKLMNPEPEPPRLATDPYFEQKMVKTAFEEALDS